ncbi:MAG: hypothetical protein ACREAB_20950, partial [Blastocatellia bacterium]
FFLALSAFYLSFTPGTIKGMGYNLENLIAADQITTNLVNLALWRPFVLVSWPRHGLLELLFELPFVFASRLLFGNSLNWVGQVMAIQPILFTSLSCAITFLWIQRLTKDLAWSYSLSLIAGVATMLWPYAYTGLETTQSFFVILSAYLALGAERRESLLRASIFGLACAMAISVKLNGIFLAPAILYLIYCYFVRDAGKPRRELIGAALAIVAVAAVYTVNRHYSSKYFSADPGASSGYFFRLLADNPWRMALYFLSYFGSINKGLFFYAPITALGLFALPRALRNHPRIAIFAVLTLAGMAGGFSLTYMWAEETWGPRYLHEAILPLTLCLAAAKTGSGLQWRREIPLLATAVLGLVISFLGSFFYYGHLHTAATSVSQNSLESLQFDPRFNHIEFNASLLKLWMTDRFGGTADPEHWPAPYHWWLRKPSDAPPEKTVDLREFASPLPLLAKGWNMAYPISSNQYRALRLSLLCSLLFSLTLFVRLAFLTARKSQASGKFVHQCY